MAGGKKRNLFVQAVAVVVLAALCLLFVPPQAAPNEMRENADEPGEWGLGEADEVEAYFCPEEKCEEILAAKIKEAKESVHCAFYDLDLGSVIGEFAKAAERGIAVGIVADNGIEGSEEISVLAENALVRFDKSDSDYMHNKFCVFDKKTVLAGSFNPTFNGAYRNNNNFLIIENRELAGNFENEFLEMWGGEFSKSSPQNTVNDLGSGYEVVFCPEDNCGGKIVEYIGKAVSKIDCMFFSFTHDAVAEAMNRADERGVEVRVVFEKSQNSQYSAYHKLNDGVGKAVDKNPYNMHNKFCIFDGEIVMAGSMNPSKHSDNDNDESVVFVRNREIAGEYGEYFLGKWNEWS